MDIPNKNKINIKSTFITSVADIGKYNPMPNEVCLCGRSNVGKSTFINMLTGKKIAKTSSTPGRTRLINFFDINDGSYTLVDLPGYGYAKAGKQEQEKWKSLIETYLKTTKSLLQAMVLVDCRIDSPLDQQMLSYLYHFNMPFTILATKADKLSRAQLSKRLPQLASFLKVGVANIIPVSNNGLNREEVLKRISMLITQE